MASRCLLSAAFFGLIIGLRSQERFPTANYQNPNAYSLSFQPITERPRPFQPYYQTNLQSQFHQQPFLSPFPTPRYQQDPGQWEPKHQFARNVSSQQYHLPFQPTSLPEIPSGSAPDGLPGVFQDPQFEQLFQQELAHQLQLEQQRQEVAQVAQRRPRVEVEVQKSQTLERPQLPELQSLHQLLQEELQQHEHRQREQQRLQQQQLQLMIQQQQQQQNQVELQHEFFMPQKIKPQQQTQPVQSGQQPPSQSGQQQPKQKQQPNSPNQQRKPPQQQTQNSPQLEILDLNRFLPFLQAEQSEAREQERRQQQQKQQEQRLKQQQRQQETLRQQEERRLEEQKHKEKLRQQRLQIQRLQQQQLEQQKNKQRQQRQQPLNNNGITAQGGGAGGNNANKTEKPIKSVRDLFNTTSCIEPPLTCPHPRVHFYLYTRTTQQNPDKIDVTNPDSLRRTPFNPQHPIKLLIHGFQGGRQFAPSTDLRKAYFIRGDYNIFVVDYNSLVRLPCLSQIQWSPSFLALCISQLVGYVDSASGGLAPPDRFHLIGYSIGAHVAGLVANYVNDGKLGRITGLDPTIIFYQGSNRSHDLDPSDAHFIDVIHTGAGILGQRGPNGHVDYYVNGGTTQPGCQSDSLIKTLSCDHTKVSPYYVESIVTPVGFWALPCPNLFMYLLGFCQPKDEDYILMGEDAPHTARGIYYLSTNGNKPYAKGFPGKKMPTKFPKWRPH